MPVKSTDNQRGYEPVYCLTPPMSAEAMANLPEAIKRIARALEETGCGEIEIRLAALALCGVPLRPLNPTLLRL